MIFISKFLIVGEYNPKYSHWRGKKSLGEWLDEKGIIGISGIDTRELVKIIRENKDVVGKISDSSQSLGIMKSMEEITQNTLAENVSLKIDCFKKKILGDKIILNENPNLLNILVIDCGIKNSQIRALLKHNVQLTIVSPDFNFFDGKTLIEYQGIFLSNGPGDPSLSTEVVKRLKNIFNMDIHIPIFGICYGHQLIGLASGNSKENEVW